MHINKIARALRPSLLALASVLAVGQAQAVAVSGNWGAGGYDTITFTVASASTVDFTYTGGYNDPTFSLFNGAGNHLVTNDDSNLGLYSHLTQNLGPGVYELLVSYCCQSANFASINGATFTSTDGFNNGSYWFGGTSTLSGMQASLNGTGAGRQGQPYALTISNVTLGGSTVPEPASLALVGAALAGLTLLRRKAKAGIKA
jgi:PEP-CTERM motif